MLNKEYYNELIESVLSLYKGTRYYYSSYTNKFYALLLAGNEDAPLKKYLAVSKEKLRDKINPEFKRLLDPIVGNQRMSIEEYANRFTSYSKDDLYKVTDQGEAIFWSYKSYDQKISANLTLEHLYNELYGEAIEITGYNSPEGDVKSFSSEAEEALSVSLSLSGQKDVKGRTVQTHVLAEDYGFDKDRFFADFALVHYNKTDSLRVLIPNFVSEERMDLIAYDALKWMHPAIQRYDSSSSLRIPAYYKKSLLCLIKTLSADKWYKADDLYKAFKSSSGIIKASRDFYSIYVDNFIKFNANLPDTEGLSEAEAFYAKYEDLVSKPIFFSLLYLFAFLGVLDITEKEPKLDIYKSKNKKIPYSPLNALNMVKISDLGKWALCLSEIKPEAKKEYSEPVLDKDLLLITYKGNSIEKKSFFASLSDPLGQIRYKVTLSSFTKTITSKADLEILIDKFKSNFAFIPEIWTNFFEEVRKTFYFLKPVDEGVIYSIKEKEIFNTLINDPTIRKYITLVENEKIFISNDDYKRLNALLSKKGYKDPFAW